MDLDRWEWHPLDEAGVDGAAPPEPGVYLVRPAGGVWPVYVGEALDVRTRLRAHLVDRGATLAAYVDAGAEFAFEAWESPLARIGRRRMLVDVFRPPCNRRAAA